MVIILAPLRKHGPNPSYTEDRTLSAGAVASSTAVTVALARMSGQAAAVRPLVGAAALAGMVSILRVLVVVTLLRLPILPHVAVPALCSAGVLGAAGLAMLFRSDGEQQPQEMLKNPFEFRALLLFAAFFAVVSTASAAFVVKFGHASLPVTSALSGMFDVDVAVL
ncbi:MAG: DUF4010 domain-containing protein, partial [Paracoccaceae bacterium]